MGLADTPRTADSRFLSRRKGIRYGLIRNPEKDHRLKDEPFTFTMEWVGWFSRPRIRWCGRLVSVRCGGLLGIRIRPKKIHMAPCRASLRLPFPRPLGKTVALPAETADRHRSCARLANLDRRCTPSHIVRHDDDKLTLTLLTLLTLREAHSFWLFADLVAGEPSDGAPTRFSRRSAGCPLQAKPGVGMGEEVRQGAIRVF